MKKILFIIVIFLCCSQAQAFVTKPQQASFNETTLWIMIPYDDEIDIFAINVHKQGTNGLIFQMEDSERGLCISQDIAAIADPPDIFAKKIAGIIHADLMFYLDYKFGYETFDLLEKIPLPNPLMTRE